MNVQNFKLRKPQKITMVGQCIFPCNHFDPVGEAQQVVEGVA